MYAIKVYYRLHCWQIHLRWRFTRPQPYKRPTRTSTRTNKCCCQISKVLKTRPRSIRAPITSSTRPTPNTRFRRVKRPNTDPTRTHQHPHRRPSPTAAIIKMPTSTTPPARNRNRNNKTFNQTTDDFPTTI